MAVTGRVSDAPSARIAARLSAGMLSVGLLAPHYAQAGVADFLAGCMAEGVDIGGGGRPA